jgi:hypothetical protein
VITLPLPSLLADADVGAAAARLRLPPPLMAYATGAVFALAASPCATPVLAAILAFAATQDSPGAGGLLLFLYSCGYVVPLLAAATATVRRACRARCVAGREDARLARPQQLHGLHTPPLATRCCRCWRRTLTTTTTHRRPPPHTATTTGRRQARACAAGLRCLGHASQRRAAGRWRHLRAAGPPAARPVMMQAM